MYEGNMTLMTRHETVQEELGVCFSGQEYLHFPLFDTCAFASRVAVPERDRKQ